jgi:hypothetical protein
VKHNDVLGSQGACALSASRCNGGDHASSGARSTGSRNVDSKSLHRLQDFAQERTLCVHAESGALSSPGLGYETALRSRGRCEKPRDVDLGSNLP